MKPILLSLALLLTALPAEAGPKRWIQHQFADHPVRTSIVLGGVGAGIHAAGLRHCRQGNVERCDEGYGAAWAFYGTITTWSVVVGPALAKSCWKDQPNWKFCNVFAYGGPAYQTTQGILDWRNYAPETSRDLPHIVFLPYQNQEIKRRSGL